MAEPDEVETPASEEQVEAATDEEEPVDFADAVARDVAAVVAEMAEDALMQDARIEAALAGAAAQKEAAAQDEINEDAPTPDEIEEEFSKVMEDPDEATDAFEFLGGSSDSGETADAASDAVVEAAMHETEDSEPEIAVEVAEEVEAEAPASQDQDEIEVAAAPTEEADAVETDPPIDESLDTKEADFVEEPVEPEAEEQGGNSDDAFTDNDLRPLISGIIRDELQGELGERITRNVRKLVRQEIHRALSVRELE